MALVPADLLKQSKPSDVQLDRLDVEMKKILEDNTIPSDLKYKLYNHVLHQHGQIDTEARKPVEIPIKKVSMGAPRMPTETLLKSVPQTKQQVATNLIDFLQSNSQGIRFNERNQLMVDGTPLDGSNLVDLFSHAVRDKKTDVPVGWNEFFRLLKDHNVPRVALGNRNILGNPEPPVSPFRTPPSGAAASSSSPGGHYPSREYRRKQQRGRGFKWTPLYK